jgi:serine/threonine protein kinase
MGQRFGNYVLQEIIGEGGVARVYNAVRAGAMGFRKPVAIKQILPHVAQNAQVVQSLINEARVGSYLEHRNVAEVHEFDQVGETWYMAMELVRGLTIGQMLARSQPRGVLPPHLVVEIGVQVCDGLYYAHEVCDELGRPLQLIHRDLKPSNVMVTYGGIAKIMDFGIAKATSNLFLTSHGQTKGTPAYMSPEQVQGDTLDSRSDQFSLASLLAEALTGDRVFSGKKMRETMYLVLAADMTEALARIDDIAPELGPILARAWQRQPGDRYTSAAEMAVDLRKALTGMSGEEQLGPWVQHLHLHGAQSTDPDDPVTLPEGAFEPITRIVDRE